jgi:hypothetical protein
VNHRCKQKQEDTLRHENATWVKDQPDFVKLCHSMFSLRPAEPRQFEVRQQMRDACHDRKDREAAHVD